MTATNKHIPGKRIKTWHRAYKRGNAGVASLKQFARMCLRGALPGEVDTATRWANGKIAPKPVESAA